MFPAVSKKTGQLFRLAALRMFFEEDNNLISGKGRSPLIEVRIRFHSHLVTVESFQFNFSRYPKRDDPVQDLEEGVHHQEDEGKIDDNPNEFSNELRGSP